MKGTKGKKTILILQTSFPLFGPPTMWIEHDRLSTKLCTHSNNTKRRTEKGGLIRNNGSGQSGWVGSGQKCDLNYRRSGRFNRSKTPGICCRIGGSESSQLVGLRV